MGGSESKSKYSTDVNLNQNLVRFGSLDSSDMLQHHYKRRMEAGDCAADWIKDLVEKLGALTPSPELAGLGALAIAVLIDMVSFSPPEDSVKDALRCVFAEEKASEVWDQIDECLKRIRMNFTNKHELKAELNRIEPRLSNALTKLKNSMLRDGHMTNDALKAWVNGAAFHIQLLIHLVRLGGKTSNQVKSLLSDYDKELDELFTEHEKVIKTKCNYYSANFGDSGGGGYGYTNVYLTTDDGQYNAENYTIEDYYNERYRSQKTEVMNHFRYVRENLQRLIGQRGSINLQRQRN